MSNDSEMGSIETLLAIWFFVLMLLVQKSCNYIEEWKISRHQQFIDTHEPFAYGVSLDDKMTCFTTAEEYDEWRKTNRKERLTELPTTFNKQRWDDFRGYQMFLYRWNDEIWSLNTLRGVKFFRCDDGQHDSYLDLFREHGVEIDQ